MFFKGFICHIIYMSNLFIPKVCILFSRNYFPRRGSFFIFTLLIEAIIISNCRKMQKWVTIKYCKVFFPLIFLGLISTNVSAQENSWKKTTSNNSNVEIWYRKACSNKNESKTVGSFGITINESFKTLNKGKWIIVKIDFDVSCSGKVPTFKTFSKKIDDLKKEGDFYRASDWIIKGGDIRSGNVSLSDQNPKQTKQQIVAKPKEVPKPTKVETPLPPKEAPVCTVIVPSRINSNSDEPVEVGQSVFLSLSDDARLCDGYNWVWYKDSCDGVPLQQDRSGRLIQTPNRTTTYYVRAEKGNIKTECRAVRVKVVKPTVYVPIKITSSSNGPVCPGESVVLRVFGGRENEAKKWIWYENGCGNTILKNDSESFTVAPKKETTYYVSDKNNPSDCASFTVRVVKPPQLQAITLSNNNAPLITKNQEAKITVCEGENILLKITNENVKDFKFNWYTDTNK